MADYARYRAAAEAQLAKHGRAAVLRRKIWKSDEEAPWKPDTAEISDYPISLLMDNYSGQMIDGTTILYGDRRVWIGAESLVMTDSDGNERAITPKPATDTIVETTSDGGEAEYMIVRVLPLAPGTVNVLYEVQARGADA